LTNEQKNVMENFHILWLDKMTMAVLFLQQTQTKGENYGTKHTNRNAFRFNQKA
jgi:hypothetical protein